jgi:glycyl-tRNA synthetase beta chain
VSIPDGAEFFLELLLEEMPAGAIPGARADLVRKFTDELAQAALSAEAITADATPRRLFVCARGLARRQEDRVVEVTGPPAEKAMDSDGNPTPMAVGFARAQGVAVTDLRRVRTARGEALLARKTIRGRPAAEILAEAAPRVLRSMTFPKMMRWGAGEHPFVRPLHRIIALYDGEVVPFEIFGVRSGRATLGHRLSDGSEITVASFDDYLGKMRAAGVEPDSSERTARLLEAARRLAAEAGGSIEANADLVPLLSDLVEWPGLVRGSFDPRYLELPEEVLVTTMRVHQKYLPIRSADGPTSSFVAVMDNREDSRGLIAQGNEWVLNARLSDARFFFDEDVREPLAGKLPKLSRLTFHEKLGDYLQKTGRIQELSEAVGALVARPGSVPPALEAARLSKVDLTTEMVREFTDLQGVVGGLYARREGAAEDVWKAIADHYRPVSADDEPPRTETGAMVSLADRFDTLAGFFGIGLVPTGSKDPYGLRRAAQGVVSIAVSRGWRVDWSAIARKAISLHGAALTRTAAETEAALLDFFEDRVRSLFSRRGLPDDVLAAVLAARSWDFADLADRARALAQARGSEAFRSLSTSVKRIRNILAGAPAKEPSTRLLREPAEQALAAEFARVQAELSGHIASRRYAEAVSAMASLAPPLDRFFVEVLVNAPEPELAENRQALLAAIDRAFSRFADISQIQVEK